MGTGFVNGGGGDKRVVTGTINPDSSVITVSGVGFSAKRIEIYFDDDYAQLQQYTKKTVAFIHDVNANVTLQIMVSNDRVDVARSCGSLEINDDGFKLQFWGGVIPFQNHTYRWYAFE